MSIPPDRPPLDGQRLRVQLQAPWLDVRVIETTSSTNDDVARLARQGAPEGTVVVAEHQQSGRGRLDRTFVLPERAAIPVSMLLRPDQVPAGQWPWLVIISGLAVCDALVSAGLPPDLKWPNDAMVDGQKICGILLERVEAGSGHAAVVGIGLNVHQTREELPVDTATSVALALGKSPDRTELLEDILASFGRRYLEWKSAGGRPDSFIDEYRERCTSLGREVRVHLPDGSTVQGLAESIDSYGRIVVGGQAYSAGDVIHLR